MTNPPEFQVSSGGAVAIQHPVTVARKSPSRLFWERFKQDKAAVGGAIVIVLLILVAIVGGPIAQALTGHHPNDIVPNSQDEFGVPFGPTSHLWFGADAEGRDLFVRTMYGARISLFVGIVASGIAVFIGLVVGLSAGFFGGILQPGLPVVIAVITLFSWSYIARIVRGYTLSLREKEFVESARAAGATNFRILWQEILPNLVGPLIVYTTLLIPTNILFEAALSYLGLGVPSTEPSWGSILNDASQLYDVAWWLMLFPGAFLIITTLAFNLLGDGLRDAFDVRTER